MSNELLPLLLGAVLGVRAGWGGGTPAARRVGAFAACLTGTAVAAASGELAVTPAFVGVDAALALAGFAAAVAASAVSRRRHAFAGRAALGGDVA